MIIEYGFYLIFLLCGFLIGFFYRELFEDNWKKKNKV